MSSPSEPVLYRPKDAMIYKVRIGRQDFERNAAGQFEVPAELAEQADLQPNLERVVPKPVPQT